MGVLDGLFRQGGNVNVRKDAQGRTIVAVGTSDPLGPALERKLRERARADARLSGFTRIRKIRTISAPDQTILEYVAYRPVALDNAPEEEQ